MFNPISEPMLPTPYRVLKVGRETADTFTLTLVAADGAPGFSFAPGQFNMLYVFGVGEVPISISGDPDRPETLVHTVRAVGAVSRGICGLKKGETLGVRGPFGVPWPVAQAPGRDVLVIAGGLGMAPLRPAVYHLLARRPEYGNLELIYGARTPEDLAFRRELERWRGRFDFRVHVTVDAARNDWRGNVGVVPNLLARARFDPEQTLALICGPGVMMRFTVQELLNRGLKMENIYVSLERNMKCGLGLCGHCQLGPFFVCKDGPVFPYDRVRDWFLTREV
jgi:NAD(P)H-flavin reductase